MPGSTSTRAAGPALGVSASAAPISPKPIAPRARWRASESLASAPRPSSCILRASVGRHAKPGAQRFASAMQPRLHRRAAETQRLGGRGSRQTLDVTQNEHRPLVGRQSRDRADDPLHLQASERGLFRGRLDLQARARPAERNPRATNALVANDLEHPRRERRRGAQGSDPAVQDDQGLPASRPRRPPGSSRACARSAARARAIPRPASRSHADRPAGPQRRRAPKASQPRERALATAKRQPQTSTAAAMK
jgi:hypothetical protein